jgi:hypothetical protein
MHKAIFGSKGPPNPRGGKVTLAAEEGMIRNLANRVVSDGIGAYDAELGNFQAAGQIIEYQPSISESHAHTSLFEAPPERRSQR